MVICVIFFHTFGSEDRRGSQGAAREGGKEIHVFGDRVKRAARGGRGGGFRGGRGGGRGVSAPRGGRRGGGRGRGTGRRGGGGVSPPRGGGRGGRRVRPPRPPNKTPVRAGTGYTRPARPSASLGEERHQQHVKIQIKPDPQGTAARKAANAPGVAAAPAHPS